MSEAITVFSRLRAVQQELKAPKNIAGRFGAHRSAESILAAVKPLLDKHKLVLLLEDIVVAVGERNYIRATAGVFDEGGQSISATGFAWEGDVSRGLDASQITGMASSYARKYALGGLFSIDDTKDADSKEYEAEEPKKEEKTFDASGGITEPQKRKVFALLAELKITSDEKRHILLERLVGKDSTSKLTKNEANTVIDFLQAKVAAPIEAAIAEQTDAD